MASWQPTTEIYENYHKLKRYSPLRKQYGLLIQYVDINIITSASHASLRTFVAVRQQTHETVLSHPLVLTTGQELVENHLRRVGEVAELRLPQHQRVGVVHGVAGLEAEHGVLRQRAVHHHVLGLVVGQVVQRRERVLKQQQQRFV